MIPLNNPISIIQFVIRIFGNDYLYSIWTLKTIPVLKEIARKFDKRIKNDWLVVIVVLEHNFNRYNKFVQMFCLIHLCFDV